MPPSRRTDVDAVKPLNSDGAAGYAPVLGLMDLYRAVQSSAKDAEGLTREEAIDRLLGLAAFADECMPTERPTAPPTIPCGSEIAGHHCDDDDYEPATGDGVLVVESLAYAPMPEASAGAGRP